MYDVCSLYQKLILATMEFFRRNIVTGLGHPGLRRQVCQFLPSEASSERIQKGAGTMK